MRGLEDDDEELLQRDFDSDAEDLWGREYGDIIVERDDSQALNGFR